MTLISNTMLILGMLIIYVSADGFSIVLKEYRQMILQLPIKADPESVSHYMRIKHSVRNRMVSILMGVGMLAGDILLMLHLRTP